MDPFELKALLLSLVLPPGALLILAAFGLLLTRSVRLRRTGMALCSVAIGVLWLLATPVVVSQLAKLMTQYAVLDMRRPVDAQAVVILAGGVRRYAPEYNDDAPNEITLQRITYGARVARKTGLPVLVTGGRGEALVMRDFLTQDFGIAPRWVETESFNTHENAVLSTPMLKQAGVNTVVLVTASLHMPRAVAEFQAQGMRVIPAPVTTYSPREGMLAKWVPGTAGLRDSRNLIYEALGNLARRMRSGD